jgi:hypothetical protein
MIEYKFKIPVGDASGDGHEKCETFVLECNYSLDDITKAYEDSCELTGVDFDGYGPLSIATEYEDSSISEMAENALKKHGLDVRSDYEYYKEHPDQELCIDGPKHFIKVLMGFIKISLPDLEYKISNDNLECFRKRVGYGLFY